MAGWTVEPLNRAVERELLALPPECRRFDNGDQVRQAEEEHAGRSGGTNRIRETRAEIRDRKHARRRAKLTQEQLAIRMNTTQTAIARMESGRHMPSMTSIRRYAEATGSRVLLRLVRN